ncbi:hypothetical protein [Nostoc paludosum]|uniref:hypothetical protein n=1 Tax=Nostoc paludosum TaxID=212362 RepID=UPI001687C42F|nr:hypothetical protein [Nostoc paludosum]
MPVPGVLGEVEPGTELGELGVGSEEPSEGVLLPGVGATLLGVPESEGVPLPGMGAILLGVPDSEGVLLGAPDSEGVVLPGVGVTLLGVPESEGVPLPGMGAILLGVPDSEGILLGAPESEGVAPGAGVVVVPSGVPEPDGVTFPGVVVLSGVVVCDGVVSAGTVVLPGAVGVTAVPPPQRELRGKYSHRIFLPSGDSLISVGELVEESLLDWAMGDLLDSATAILVVSAKDRAVPIRVRDFPIIMKLTSTEHSHY